jgi:hypothetical protein
LGSNAFLRSNSTHLKLKKINTVEFVQSDT